MFPNQVPQVIIEVMGINKCRFLRMWDLWTFKVQCPFNTYLS